MSKKITDKLRGILLQVEIQNTIIKSDNSTKKQKKKALKDYLVLANRVLTILDIKK